MFGSNGLETSTSWNYKVTGRYIMPLAIGVSGTWRHQSGNMWGRVTSVPFPGDGAQNVRMEEVSSQPRSERRHRRRPRGPLLPDLGKLGKLTGQVDVFNLLNSGVGHRVPHHAPARPTRKCWACSTRGSCGSASASTSSSAVQVRPGLRPGSGAGPRRWPGSRRMPVQSRAPMLHLAASRTTLCPRFTLGRQFAPGPAFPSSPLLGCCCGHAALSGGKNEAEGNSWGYSCVCCSSQRPALRTGLPWPYQRHGHRQHRRRAAGRHRHGQQPGADPAAGAGDRRGRRLPVHRAAARRLRGRLRARRLPERQARGRARRHQPDADRRPAAERRHPAGDGHRDRRLAGRRHLHDAGRHQLHEGTAHRDSRTPATSGPPWRRRPASR